MTITTDAVDTGERRTYGRYTARRVVTTTKTEPGPSARTPASAIQEDGWYIDVPDANCENTAGHGHAVFATLASIRRPGDDGPDDRFEFKQLGTARTGFPLARVVRTGSDVAALALAEHATQIELIDISETPLDPALFTVPEGYRAALPLPYGHHDLTRPDTIMNRLESYRVALASWVNHLLGYRGY